MMNLKWLVKKYSLLKMDHVLLTNEFNGLKDKYDNYMSTSYTKCEDLELSNLEHKGVISKLIYFEKYKKRLNYHE